jgi:tetratricopeptide (TPR) repeat protein
MRFADFGCGCRDRISILVAGLVAAALVGCSAIGDPMKSIQQTVSPAPAATATKTAAAPAPTPAPTPVADVPVSPNVQRAFDDASRAMRAGRNDEAERAFKSIAQANPDLGGPHANLGVIYRQGGKLNEAAGEFEQAVRLNPKQPIYFNQLGVTYRQQGKFAKAREAYERAISLDENYAAPYLNLGILNDMYLGDGKRALELYDRYLALSPSGDALVTKWIADLKNRKPAPNMESRKEKA